MAVHKSGRREAVQDCEAAPEDLRLLQNLLNTANRTQSWEDLDSPQALETQLATWRLLPEGASLTATDLERVIALREGLRSVLLARSGADVAREDLEALDRLAESSAVRIRFATDAKSRFSLASEDTDGVLGLFLATAAAASHSEEWSRLRACPAPDCGLIFYDRSRGRRARWCHPRCGNRASVRSYRQRYKKAHGVFPPT